MGEDWIPRLLSPSEMQLFFPFSLLLRHSDIWWLAVAASAMRSLQRLLKHCAFCTYSGFYMVGLLKKQVQALVQTKLGRGSGTFRTLLMYPCARYQTPKW